MAATVNITPTAPTDGLVYASAVPLTLTEATLGGGSGAQTPEPISVAFGQTLVAVIQLTVNGIIVGNNTYVVLQTDLGDGVWIDVAWIVWTGSQGTATFVMCVPPSFTGTWVSQQTRQPGSSPTTQANGSINLALGGRVRFVGKATAVGGSSSLAGSNTVVSVTIKYKLHGLR